eukprot:bmy_06707T0
MISAAQLLDELMGRDRNLAPDEKRSNVRWDHESVCKYYLCGFCPAELFTNTRSDLGPCEKIHDENLRKQYEKSSRFMKVGYERDFLRYLQSLLAEVERRIRRGHARLALSQNQQSSGIEELGSEGKVEEAQGMMKLVEQLKEERELLRSTTSTIESFAAQEKQMEVCEVCGAFLIVGDAQSRVDDHLMGKQHMGYAKIKATVEELKEKLRKRTEEPDRDERLKKEKQEREEREKEREREREERERKRRREEEEREKERARDRERRKRKAEIDEEAEAMIDQKESIDLVVGIEEDQKAEIESHISTGAKVGTENKIENPRRKRWCCERPMKSQIKNQGFSQTKQVLMPGILFEDSWKKTENGIK